MFTKIIDSMARNCLLITLYNKDTGEVFRQHEGMYNLQSKHDRAALMRYFHDFFDLMSLKRSDPRFDSFELSFQSRGEHKDLQFPF